MIFNLFKSKPTLKELIPNGFVDIHSHILPGIDDGAKNIEESVELIKKMRDLGFSKIIGTPHTYSGVHNNSNESIENAYLSLQENIKNDIKISFASEYMIDNTILKKIEEKSLLCLKENYVLVEMSYISANINLYEIIFKLQLNDYIPVIAHPERYRYFHENFSEYVKMKNIGCKFQMNLLSTTGYYGNEILKISNKLLKENMIDFVGSDIHNQNHINNFSNSIKINCSEKLQHVINSTIVKFD